MKPSGANTPTMDYNTQTDRAGQNLTKDDFQTVVNKKRRSSDPEIAEARKNRRKVNNERKEADDLLMANRYEPLSDMDDDTEVNPMRRQPPAKNQTPGRKYKPPPVVITGKPTTGKHVSLITFLNENVVDKKYKIKYTNNTNIYVETEEAHIKLVKDLQHKGIHFHTFTRSDQKTHAFVLSGLHHAPHEDEIKEELVSAHALKVREVYKMRNTYAPKYLVITDASTNMHDVTKIKHISYTIVTWQRRQNKQVISQCHRCQEWGHATSNCFRPYRCLKCAGPHNTADCTKQIEEPPKCANCDGAHTANNTDCPVYKAKLEFRAKPRNEVKQPPRYVPAPPPKESAWRRPLPMTHTRPAATNPPATLNDLRLEVQKMDKHNNELRASVQTGKTGCDDQLNNFNDLANEFKILNSLININEVLKNVRELNRALMQCTSMSAKMAICTKFFAGLDTQEN